MAIVHQTPAPISAGKLNFAGPQVTWAGEFPSTHGLCFGMEDGSIGVRDINGVDLWSRPVLDSREAINGVAFSHNLVAISTRAELIVMRSSSSDEFQPLLLDQIGVHGVVSTGRGGFIAPAGASGVLQIESLPDGRLQGSQIRARGAELYFYRIARLGTTTEGREIFACAGRNDGVIALELGPDGQPVRVVINRSHHTTSKELADIVDVCHLPSDIHPFATASLGIDNSIHLSEDIRSGQRRLGLHFPEMQGTAYSVLSAQGHLFILTSEALYFLPKLADRFVKGEPVDGKRMTVRTIPLEALDCSIAYGEYLMIINAESVLLAEISQLAASSGVEASEMAPDVDQFAWETPKEFPFFCDSTSSATASVTVG